MMAKNLDPENHSARLYRLIGVLITKLEGSDTVTIKDLYMALASISRMQLYCQQLRLMDAKDEPTAGSAVRKYSAAFTAHDARRRKALARTAAADADGDDLVLGDDDEADDRDSA